MFYCNHAVTIYILQTPRDGAIV